MTWWESLLLANFTKAEYLECHILATPLEQTAPQYSVSKLTRHDYSLDYNIKKKPNT